MVSSMALEIRGRSYVLYDTAVVNRLVYQLFFLPVLKFIKAEIIMRPKPYRSRRYFKILLLSVTENPLLVS